MTTITIDRSVLVQALEALEYGGLVKKQQALTALRAAFAQEQDKPVTYSTGGFQLEAGFYSAVDLREMLKALESTNVAARSAMEEMP